MSENVETTERRVLLRFIADEPDHYAFCYGCGRRLIWTWWSAPLGHLPFYTIVADHYMRRVCPFCIDRHRDKWMV